MSRSYVAENDAARARLKAFVRGVSDGTMARAIGHGWTVGAALAHLAFWDRLWLAKFDEFERTGAVRIPPVEGFVNGIFVNFWLAPVKIISRLVKRFFN